MVWGWWRYLISIFRFFAAAADDIHTLPLPHACAQTVNGERVRPLPDVALQFLFFGSADPACSFWAAGDDLFFEGQMFFQPGINIYYRVPTARRQLLFRERERGERDAGGRCLLVAVRLGREFRLRGQFLSREWFNAEVVVVLWCCGMEGGCVVRWVRCYAAIRWEYSGSWGLMRRKDDRLC